MPVRVEVVPRLPPVAAAPGSGSTRPGRRLRRGPYGNRAGRRGMAVRGTAFSGVRLALGCGSRGAPLPLHAAAVPADGALGVGRLLPAPAAFESMCRQQAAVGQGAARDGGGDAAAGPGALESNPRQEPAAGGRSGAGWARQRGRCGGGRTGSELDLRSIVAPHSPAWNPKSRESEPAGLRGVGPRPARASVVRRCADPGVEPGAGAKVPRGLRPWGVEGVPRQAETGPALPGL